MTILTRQIQQQRRAMHYPERGHNVLLLHRLFKLLLFSNQHYDPSHQSAAFLELLRLANSIFLLIKSFYLDMMNGHPPFLHKYIWKLKVPLNLMCTHLLSSRGFFLRKLF